MEMCLSCPVLFVTDYHMGLAHGWLPWQAPGVKGTVVAFLLYQEFDVHEWRNTHI